MSREMGYHYTPCNSRRTEAGTGIAVILVLTYVLVRFWHTILEVLTMLAIGLGIGAVMVMVVCIYWAVEARKGEKLYMANKARKASVAREDVRTIVLFREWLSLPLEDRVTPEWDFFTELNDGNRAKALETMKRQEAGNAARNRC